MHGNAWLKHSAECGYMIRMCGMSIYGDVMLMRSIGRRGEFACLETVR